MYALLFSTLQAGLQFHEDFADGNYTSKPTWTAANSSYPWVITTSGGISAATPSGLKSWDQLQTSITPITNGAFKVSFKVRFNSSTVQAEGMNQFQIKLYDSQNSFYGYKLAVAQGARGNSGVFGGSSYLPVLAAYAFPTTEFVTVEWVRNATGTMRVTLNGIPYITGTDTTFSRFDRLYLGVTASDATTSTPSAQTVSFADIQVQGSSSRTSCVELPLDRFDEYLIGQLPPYPWKTLGTIGTTTTLSLQQSGESPFVNNLVSGKGLVMTDSSTIAGQGSGIAYDFAAPPPGRLYLGFDFKTTGSIQTGNGPDFVCELTDELGRGLSIHLGESASLSAGATGATTTSLSSLVTDRWYHLAVDITANQSATLSLKDSATQAITSLGTITFSPVSGMSAYRSLRFYNAGPNTRTGGWALDNVCMAGEVEASRASWLPFTKNSVDSLRACTRKVYAYYYEIYPSSYSSSDPGLAWYTRTLFNPSMAPSDRMGAGTEMLFRPLPRPRMASGQTSSEEMITSMEEEVRLAIQMGLDGFFVDFFANPTLGGGRPTFNQRSFALMEAANRVDPSFKIIPAIYADGYTPQQYAECATMVSALTNSQTLRLSDGRALFSMWGTNTQTTNWWSQVFSYLSADGFPTALIGQFNGLPTSTLSAYAPLCHGMADWGPRSPVNYSWVPRIRNLTTLAISPTVFQDVRTRNCIYWESHNSDTFRMTWNLAMQDSSDWVFVDTWSDYTEQAQAPSTAIGYSFYDLNTYYIQWFKTGQQPTITRDVVYYVYRKHHTNLAPNKGNVWTAQTAGGIATTNEIEMLTFLKDSATLQIDIGGVCYTQTASAGIASFKVPMPSGQALQPPIFSVIRNNQVVLCGQGRVPILNQVEYQNLLYQAGVIASEN